MRAFFSVNLTPDVRDRIAGAADELRSSLPNEPVRWVRPEILHLTLRFLGETAPEKLEAIRVAVVHAARNWSPCALGFAGMGCFPDARRPRVLWVGVSDPARALTRIAEELERIARAHGFDPEERGFTPHMTLGRIRDRLSPDGIRRLAAALEARRESDFGMFTVETIHLMRSVLRPSGPEYAPIAAFDLTAGHAEGDST